LLMAINRFFTMNTYFKKADYLFPLFLYRKYTISN
jgi:hypothetical protein